MEGCIEHREAITRITTSSPAAYNQYSKYSYSAYRNTCSNYIRAVARAQHRLSNIECRSEFLQGRHIDFCGLESTPARANHPLLSIRRHLAERHLVVWQRRRTYTATANPDSHAARLLAAYLLLEFHLPPVGIPAVSSHTYMYVLHVRFLSLHPYAVFLG